MDQTYPPSASGAASLAAVLDRVDAALAQPGLAWLEKAVATGLWAAWLAWIVRLLAFGCAAEQGEAGGLWDVSGAPDGDRPPSDPVAGAARPLSHKALERKIRRLMAAAGFASAPCDSPPPRPLRRRRRRIVRAALRWLGLDLQCGFGGPAILSGFLRARLLALRKP
jgi:hypothetical protein